MPEEVKKDEDVKQEEEEISINVDEASLEELAELEKQELESGQEDKKEEEALPVKDEKQINEDNKDNKDNKEPEERINKHGEKITGDPLKDTKAALTRSQQEIAELKKQLRENELKSRERSVEGFKKLSESELQDLKVDDPDGYIEYVLAEKAHEQNLSDLDSFKKESEEAEKKASEELLSAQQVEATTEMRNNIVDFISDITGKTSEESLELLSNRDSNEYKLIQEMDQFVVENLTPQKIVGDMPVYNARQLKMAYNAIKMDDIVSGARKSAREEVVNAIDNASKGGSHFDRLPSDNSGNKGKTIDQYSQDEINAMTYDQLVQLEKEFKTGV